MKLTVINQSGLWLGKHQKEKYKHVKEGSIVYVQLDADADEYQAAEVVEKGDDGIVFKFTHEPSGESDQYLVKWNILGKRMVVMIQSR